MPDVQIDVRAPTGPLSRDMRRARGEVDEFASGSQRSLDRLAAGGGRGLDALATSVRSFGLAVVAGASGFALLARRQARYIQDIDNSARATGLARSEVQSYAAALETLGRDGDDVGELFTDIADRLTELRQGTSTYVDDFGLLNLRARDFIGLNLPQSLRLIEDRMQEVGVAQRAAFSARFLPQYQVVLGQISNTQADMARRIGESNTALEIQSDNLDELNRRWQAFQPTLQGILTNVVDRIAGGFNRVTDAVGDFFDNVLPPGFIESYLPPRAGAPASRPITIDRGASVGIGDPLAGQNLIELATSLQVLGQQGLATAGQLDPLFGAQQRYLQQLEQLGAAFDTGLISADRYNQAVSQAGDLYDRTANSLEAAAESTSGPLSQIGPTLIGTVAISMTSDLRADSFSDFGLLVVEQIAATLLQASISGLLTNALAGTAFGGFLGIPTAHEGTVVPGRPGQERLYLLEAGETVRTARQEAQLQGGAGSVTFSPNIIASRQLEPAVIQAIFRQLDSIAPEVGERLRQQGVIN